MQEHSTDADGRARITRSGRLVFASFCPRDTFVPHASRARATCTATSLEPRKQALSLAIYLGCDTEVSNPLGPLGIFKFDKQVRESRGETKVFFFTFFFFCQRQDINTLFFDLSNEPEIIVCHENIIDLKFIITMRSLRHVRMDFVVPMTNDEMTIAETIHGKNGFLDMDRFENNFVGLSK